ncbi:hypothetical protein APS67_005794 [Streptomyces sp. AVP053U2]|nr:hypothetical protein APS67_005794 [Streptomyces sp. AVP053U2]
MEHPRQVAGLPGVGRRRPGPPPHEPARRLPRQGALRRGRRAAGTRPGAQHPPAGHGRRPGRTEGRPCGTGGSGDTRRAGRQRHPGHRPPGRRQRRHRSCRMGLAGQCEPGPGRAVTAVHPLPPAQRAGASRGSRLGGRPPRRHRSGRHHVRGRGRDQGSGRAALVHGAGPDGGPRPEAHRAGPDPCGHPEPRPCPGPPAQAPRPGPVRGRQADARVRRRPPGAAATGADRRRARTTPRQPEYVRPEHGRPAGLRTGTGRDRRRAAAQAGRPARQGRRAAADRHPSDAPGQAENAGGRRRASVPLPQRGRKGPGPVRRGASLRQLGPVRRRHRWRLEDRQHAPGRRDVRVHQEHAGQLPVRPRRSDRPGGRRGVRRLRPSRPAVRLHQQGRLHAGRPAHEPDGDPDAGHVTVVPGRRVLRAPRHRRHRTGRHGHRHRPGRPGPVRLRHPQGARGPPARQRDEDAETGPDPPVDRPGPQLPVPLRADRGVRPRRGDPRLGCRTDRSPARQLGLHRVGRLLLGRQLPTARRHDGARPHHHPAAVRRRQEEVTAGRLRGGGTGPPVGGARRGDRPGRDAGHQHLDGPQRAEPGRGQKPAAASRRRARLQLLQPRYGPLRLAAPVRAECPVLVREDLVGRTRRGRHPQVGRTGERPQNRPLPGREVRARAAGRRQRTADALPHLEPGPDDQLRGTAAGRMGRRDLTRPAPRRRPAVRPGLSDRGPPAHPGHAPGEGVHLRRRPAHPCRTGHGGRSRPHPAGRVRRRRGGRHRASAPRAGGAPRPAAAAEPAEGLARPLGRPAHAQAGPGARRGPAPARAASVDRSRHVPDRAPEHPAGPRCAVPAEHHREPGGADHGRPAGQTHGPRLRRTDLLHPPGARDADRATVRGQGRQRGNALQRTGHRPARRPGKRETRRGPGLRRHLLGTRQQRRRRGAPPEHARADPGRAQGMAVGGGDRLRLDGHQRADVGEQPAHPPVPLRHVPHRDPGRLLAAPRPDPRPRPRAAGTAGPGRAGQRALRPDGAGPPEGRRSDDRSGAHRCPRPAHPRRGPVRGRGAQPLSVRRARPRPHGHRAGSRPGEGRPRAARRHRRRAARRTARRPRGGAVQGVPAAPVRDREHGAVTHAGRGGEPGPEGGVGQRLATGEGGRPHPGGDRPHLHPPVPRGELRPEFGAAGPGGQRPAGQGAVR